MKRRHFQNCLSIEKNIFESNVKKYKSLLKNNSVKSETIKIAQVKKIVGRMVAEPNFVEICSADSVPGYSRSAIVEEFDSDDTKPGYGRSTIEEEESDIEDFEQVCSAAFVEENSSSEESIMSEEIKAWAVRNNISRAAFKDLLRTLKRVGVVDFPLSAKTLNTSKENMHISTVSNDKNIDILQALKNINSRLQNIEDTQTNIIENQSILSNGQNTIVSNQQNIATKLEKLMVESKAESMAQTQMLMECKVAIKRVKGSVGRMNGETKDHNFEKISGVLPLKTLQELNEVEQQLQTEEFCQLMISYLHKLKGTSEDASTVIRSLLTDDLLDKFNWDGRWGKESLGKLMLFEKVLRDVFQEQDSLQFEKSIRKAVERSHHRSKQKKYIKRLN
ncbi:uncharacterized protein ACRADG_003974 [Cochliomyia hominivorax]